VHELSIKQEAREKRRLLNFVLSNSTWNNGELTPEFRQPFDVLAVTNKSYKSKRAARACPGGTFENWLRR
jgi:hypothetical protein